MAFFKKIFRWLIALSWYTFAITVVLLAAGFGLARLMLPYASEYTADIEQQMSATLGQPVKVKSLDAEWIGFTPTLVLNDVAMYSKTENKNDKVLLRFPKIRIGINIYDSLVEGQPVFTRFDLAGIDLFVKRDAQGEFSVRGVEVAGENAEKPENLDFGKWIFTHSRLSLELNNLVIIDNYRGQRKHRFNNVSLVLRNDGQRHQISSVFRFPESKQKELSIYVDSSGDPLDWSNWNGKIYAIGSQISPVQFFEKISYQNLGLKLDSLDFEVWADVSHSRLVSVQGKLNAPRIQLSRSDIADADLDYRNLRTAFQWERNLENWSLVIKDFTLQSKQGKWPSSVYTFSYKPSGQNTAIGMHASYFRTDELNSLLRFAKGKLPNTVAGLQDYVYSGELHNFNLQSGRSQNELFLSSAFNRLSIQSKQDDYGFSQLSGNVRVLGNNGSVTLHSQHASFNVARLFQDNYWLGDLDGEIAWRRDKEEIKLNIDYLEVNNDYLHLNTQGEIRLDKNFQPDFDLTGALYQFKIKKLVDYLPNKALSKSSVSWLRNALLGGRLTHGEFVLKGHGRDYPFRRNRGKFELMAQVEQGQLKHSPDWPLIGNINGRLRFDGKRLRLGQATGSSMGAALQNVEIDIPDMTSGTPRLLANGVAKGTTQSKLNYVKNAKPLNDLFGELLHEVNVQGNSNLAMGLDIGLSKGGGVQYNMDLSLTDNRIALIGGGNGGNNILTHGSGDVHIDNEGVIARNIRAVMFGQEANINIETKQAEKGRLRDKFIFVSMQGYFSAAEFSRDYLPVIKDLSGGIAPWNVNVSIPLGQHARNQRGDQGVELDISSDLQGVELRLPKPFQKTAKQKKPLRASVVFTNRDDIIYNVRFGGDLDLILKTGKSARDFKGEVRFDSGSAVMPNSRGLHLVGHLEEFSVDIWKSLVDQIEVDYQKAVASSDPGDSDDEDVLIKSAELKIDHFVFLGQVINNLQLAASRKSKFTKVQLNSKAIKGELLVPRDLKAGKLVLDLDYWHLNSAEGGAGGDIDPRELPALQANIDLVTYDKRKFGKVAFSASKLVEGLRLENLMVASSTTEIDGFGIWQVFSGKQVSEFQFNLSSSDIGATMQDLGYVDSIEGGEGTVSVRVSWQGGLPSVNLEKVNGQVQFKLANGRLLEYDPLGGASILGLFSIQTLPKRLLLDFSDLYRKGLEFDNISGSFDLSDGDAYTKNFTMEGSVVSASLAGRIGLVNQDYDQLIKVDVHVADFISFVGLLVSSPWSVILPQLLKDEFKTTLTYSLSGNWADPKLEPLVQDLLVPDEEEDEF